MNSKIFTATAAAMALSFAAAPAYAGFIEGAITMRHATGRSLKRVLLPSVTLFLKGLAK